MNPIVKKNSTGPQDFESVQRLQENNIISISPQDGKLLRKICNVVNNAIANKNNKNSAENIDILPILQNRIFRSNQYAVTAFVLESSNLNYNKFPNLPLYINKHKALMYFLASGIIDMYGKDFDKNLMAIDIVSGRPYLCDFRLILQKKLSEIAVDISCTYDIQRTLEDKCRIIREQYNKNYPAATSELRNYSTLGQPKQLYFIDLNNLQRTSRCKLVLYLVSQDGCTVDGPIPPAQLSTYLENHKAVHYVSSNELLISDKNGFVHTKLREPVYTIEDFNSILASNNLLEISKYLIIF